MANPKKTVILGASGNPARYSYLALKRLHAAGHPVLAVGKKPVTVDGIEITNQPPVTDGVDTVTLYLNPSHQKAYYDYIIGLHPKRLIFNPGAENEELADLAQSNGIQAVEACTLVMLNTGQF